MKPQPAQKWKKAELKQWLDNKGQHPIAVFWLPEALYVLYVGISYPEGALKKDMWEIIKQSRTPPKHVVDEIVREKGLFIRVLMESTKIKSIGRT